MTREQWVVQNISDYLGMDLKKLLRETDAIVYGGAVRDSLAFLPISDVDIAVLPRACQMIYDRLESTSNFFFQINDYEKIESLYDEINVIFHPYTFEHVKTGARVQLIRPKTGLENKHNEFTKSFIEDLYRGKLRAFVGQVDFSNCGVFYDLSLGLQESVSGAFQDIKERVFRPLEENSMYVEKAARSRKEKFIQRGWQYYDSKNSN